MAPGTIMQYLLRIKRKGRTMSEVLYRPLCPEAGPLIGLALFLALRLG